MKSDILIIGAGPAGLACAMELSKGKKVESTIIEKTDSAGGLAKTLIFKEGKLIFRTDIGPHRFFSKNPYLYKFIKAVLGNDWIKVNRKTRQLIEGKFYDYPINAMQAFRNVGVIRSAQMGISYLAGSMQFGILNKKVNSFEDHIIAHFGKQLGEFNMLNYTEKVWGIPCTKIHPDWAIQRIKGLNLTSALKNALFKSSDGPKTLVDSFYYPRYGTGQIYEKLYKKAKAKGSKFLFNSEPEAFIHDGKKISLVKIKEKNGAQDIVPDKVVSSMHVTDLVNLLVPAAPKEVLEAAKNLKWRSQVYLFLTIDKEQVTDDNWIYLPDRGTPFGRIAEMKNFSKEMSPKGKTSLFIEFFCNENDSIWNKNKEELVKETITEIEKLGLVKKSEVRSSYLFKSKKSYPIYDLDYKKNTKIIMDYLNKFENLYCIGRPGRFQYTNQDHSLEMGILAAKSIIQGKKYDISKIGSEEEYFEKGEISENE
ncbi:MAG: FAD-dependent oxidoreductase [Candidatus Diapherotrites archaeon]|nr:FAD-dependent oxidoreductase [Candidatus Diapherotrites archaeon]